MYIRVAERVEYQNDRPAEPAGAHRALCPSVSFLAMPWRVDRALIGASERARATGTTAARVMMAAGDLDPDAYAAAVARAGGLELVRAEDVKQCLFRGTDPERTLVAGCMVHARLNDDRLRFLVAPDPDRVATMLAFVQTTDLHDRMAIISQTDMRRAILASAEGTLAVNARDRLAHEQPHCSARNGADFRQGALLTVFAVLVVYTFSAAPSVSAIGLHLALSLFFLGCVIIRLGAATRSRGQAHMHAHRPISAEARDDRGKPVYTVMVTLLHESAVVPGLIHHLKQLRWPAEKLEIKLICEADDDETLDALAGQTLDGRFEVVRVPPVGPRTKPKALAYALPFARGRFVTLYDAEDRPHPEQLEEAWSVFSTSGPDLACLQAPLVIANAGHNMLTAVFHLEYAGLFRRLLPFLAFNDHAIPLGGTSNHFRRDALDAVGGWDPYNVTEDADLGLRLWRRGYRTATITRPTLEDAPEQFMPWLKQRTRWFKGWMQTWIVQCRRPHEVIARRGWSGLVVMHVILTGVIVSSLLHPLMVMNAVFVLHWLLLDAQNGSAMVLIAWIDWLAVLASYVAFAVLGWTGTKKPDRWRVGWRIAAIPLYWMLMSLAAWRALHQIFARPFLWEKTPHKPYHFNARDTDAHHDRPVTTGRRRPRRSQSGRNRPDRPHEGLSGRSPI